ncbi:MAG: VacJ family lipoprotein [Proteobacteria bacterium]|jgi:phospholipid-binding lipoprotein MlaA|nr:ABC transporter [Methylibium sp.]MBY0365556.1 VacJ family lipoprotein [Burkholderiaceae bacterium]MCH8857189.1 VacJ family lipoprotein [Pseudomonadota bacterium]|mmetsp:Transcript_18060/g.43068  ORF Transcript_18060/g.43068 Transcript_18060/m.43068 type:complete len:266 (+) Transcript_18060:626-1423(+)
MSRMGRALRWLAALVLVLELAGCQTVQSVGDRLQGAVDRVMGSKGQKLDPWESWNRKVFAFNEALDENLLKPAATAYAKVLPSPIRTGIGNFLGNIADAWSAVNLLLQGRLKAGLDQGMRVAVNSTFGLAGLLDVASEAGLEKNSQDFGKTLGKWGMGTGAYIVWPVFGPSSVRDSIGLPFDWKASPSVVFDDGHKKVAITVLSAINTRANFLRAGEMLDGIALDKYTFYRDAYLQRRGSFDDDEQVEVLAPAAPASAPASAAMP